VLVYLAADQHQPFPTIPCFLLRSFLSMDLLFHQVLLECRDADHARLGRMELDETSIKANVSRHRFKSCTQARREYEKLRVLAKEIFLEEEKFHEEKDKLYRTDTTPLLYPAPPNWRERQKNVWEALRILEEGAKRSGKEAPKTTAQN
jgi:hypothetical protein